jgi:hypothetical protein
MLKKVQLGSEAIRYIAGSLSEGRSLSKYLLVLPLEKGNVTTWVDSATDHVALTHFKTGGIIAGEARRKADRMLARFVSSYLAQADTRYGIFEHALASEGDPFLLTKRINYFVHKSEVYFFVTSKDGTPTKVDEAIKVARTYFFTGLLADLPDSQNIMNHQEADITLLKSLVDNTNHIIVGAYDGEGNLLWSRD